MGDNVYIIKEKGGIFRDAQAHSDAITAIGFIPQRNLILLGCRGGLMRVLEMGLNMALGRGGGREAGACFAL